MIFITPREIKAEARHFFRKSGTLPPLGAMSALALLVAASCKSVASAFFSLPSLGFITASSIVTPDTPVGSVLSEQMTASAYSALKLAGAFACDLLMLAVLAPIAAGLFLCVMRAVSETELPNFGSRRGLSAFSAGGFGHFFTTANQYRRAAALAFSMTLRAAVKIAFVALPLWAVSERGGTLAFAAAYLPDGFPLLPTAGAVSALFALLALYDSSRRFAVASYYIGDTSLTLHMAARRSAALTHGHRAETSALMLSFAGWWVIGFLTLGIVLALYALPYYMCCKTVLIKKIGSN